MDTRLPSGRDRKGAPLRALSRDYLHAIDARNEFRCGLTVIQSWDNCLHHAPYACLRERLNDENRNSKHILLCRHDLKTCVSDRRMDK